MWRIFSSFSLVCLLFFDANAQNEDVIIREIDPPGSSVVEDKVARSLLDDAEKVIEEAEKALSYSKDKDSKTLLLEEESGGFKDIALLKVLNKITARTSILSVIKGMTAQFGNLDIKMHKCWKSPPTEHTEAKALLEIWEKKPSKDSFEDVPGTESMIRKQIFLGWMFASSPALFSLEHPIYDITVQDCKS